MDDRSEVVTTTEAIAGDPDDLQDGLLIPIERVMCCQEENNSSKNNANNATNDPFRLMTESEIPTPFNCDAENFRTRNTGRIENIQVTSGELADNMATVSSCLPSVTPASLRCPIIDEDKPGRIWTTGSAWKLMPNVLATRCQSPSEVQVMPGIEPDIPELDPKAAPFTPRVLAAQEISTPFELLTVRDEEVASSADPVVALNAGHAGSITP